ncbi:Lin1244/Lin1753 domain-containing protein [Haliea salexigens]|uniref:Lin1244/Lin1753 domain-containing protein n=1 Tax=Haliea salexigens TaxID=287487 RepID=UPI00068473E2|nr:Lin1244/Lin1753 domain-containing protein [Haliea salexigens]
MQWFKHDSNASADAKLKRVRMKYGLQGYGLYWYCLELIAQSVEAHNLTFELEHDAEVIAYDVGLSREIVQEMMIYMVNLGLFSADSQGRIFCVKMLKRMDSSMTSNAKMREMLTKAKQNHDGVMIGHDEGMTSHDSVMQERKKEEKERKSGRFTPPSVDEVSEYCSSRGNSVDAQAFVDHYESNGWMRGKTKIKCWKACVRTWESKREAPKSGSGMVEI